MTFKHSGEPYSGYVAAVKWLQKEGYSFGAMQGINPIGIIKGKYVIQKWSQMSFRQKAKLDGQIEFPYGNPRTNHAVIKLRAEL